MVHHSRRFHVAIICMVIVFIFCLPLRASSDSYEQDRHRMVNDQLRARDISDEKVLNAMLNIPRHLFVPPRLASKAYEDHPLPIGEGQTISQPYVVGLMTQYLEVQPGQRVLEIGTGSGYQAAVLAELTGEVYSIEIRPNLAKQAQKRLEGLGYQHVNIKSGDGYYGWPEAAPFDAIIITAAVNHIPPPLVSQLKKGGRLILPLGNVTFFQTLTLITKKEDLTMDVEHLTTVRFVPMTGEAQK